MLFSLCALNLISMLPKTHTFPIPIRISKTWCMDVSDLSKGTHFWHSICRNYTVLLENTQVHTAKLHFEKHLDIPHLPPPP